MFHHFSSVTVTKCVSCTYIRENSKVHTEKRLTLDIIYLYIALFSGTEQHNVQRKITIKTVYNCKKKGPIADKSF